MKKNKDVNIILTLLMFVLMIQHVNATTPIDIHKSSVDWLGTKVTGQHNGNLELKKGEVTIEKGKLKSGRFIFDMTSIKVLDIEDKKWNRKLEQHLKDKDFFGVKHYPTAVFEFNQASPIKETKKGEPNYHIKGDLTIKSITHALEFNARVDLKKSGSHASGKIIVDRTKYGIRYKSGKFFEGLGDKAIHDEFIITFDVITK